MASGHVEGLKAMKAALCLLHVAFINGRRCNNYARDAAIDGAVWRSR
jgi:hypothetical protein